MGCNDKENCDDDVIDFIMIQMPNSPEMLLSYLGTYPCRYYLGVNRETKTHMGKGT